MKGVASLIDEIGRRNEGFKERSMEKGTNGKGGMRKQRARKLITGCSPKGGDESCGGKTCNICSKTD